MVIQVISTCIRSWIIIFLSNTINIQLVSNLISHLLKLPLDFFQNSHIGDIVSRFESITSIKDKLSTGFIIDIVDGLMIIITLIIMIVYSPLLTFVILGALFFYLLIHIAFYTQLKKYTQEYIINTANERSIFIESIRAILTLKIFCKEDQRKNIWLNSYDDKLNSEIILSKIKLLCRFIMGIIFACEYIIIIILASLLILEEKRFSIGMMIAYLAYRQQLVSKAQDLIEKIIQYYMIKLHLERVANIMFTEVEEDKSRESIYKDIQGKIRIENLSFKYSQQENYIFNNINVEIDKGEILATIGPSGCGKTTLIKIMLSLLTPTSGNIFVDETNINDIKPHNYRSQISAVMQEDALLSGSIADNIYFFDTDTDLNHIYECAKLASVHEEIIKMPMSYNS